MPHSGRVLAINPGSTSTKFAVYRSTGCELERTLRHSVEELTQFEGQSVLVQHDYRAAAIAAELKTADYAPDAFAAVAGRGGLLPPLQSGTYLVYEPMLDELRQARRGEHASNLGAFLAQTFAARAGVNAYVVDPVSVDEWSEVAHVSDSTLIPRNAFCHALNTKAVAKRFACKRRVPGVAWRQIAAVATPGKHDKSIILRNA